MQVSEVAEDVCVSQWDSLFLQMCVSYVAQALLLACVKKECGGPAPFAKQSCPSTHSTAAVTYSPQIMLPSLRLLAAGCCLCADHAMPYAMLLHAWPHPPGWSCYRPCFPHARCREGQARMRRRQLLECNGTPGDRRTHASAAAPFAMQSKECTTPYFSPHQQYARLCAAALVDGACLPALACGPERLGDRSSRGSSTHKHHSTQPSSSAAGL